MMKRNQRARAGDTVLRCSSLGLLFLAVIASGGEREGPTESTINFPSGKSTVRAIQFQPAGKGLSPAILIVHGDFGLNDWTRKQARHLADKGYLVLAVDLYDGELPKTVEEAHILERGLDEREVLAKLKSAVDYLLKMPAAKGPVGILGWDSGGGYALDSALNDRRLKSSVMVCGRVTTDTKKLAMLQAHVLALFGGKDEGIPPATIEQFRKAMEKADKPATIHIYPESGNSFMDPSSPYFEGKANSAVIDDAWSRIDAAMAKALKR
jgi:carboxymethylenebutenolidase